MNLSKTSISLVLIFILLIFTYVTNFTEYVPNLFFEDTKMMLKIETMNPYVKNVSIGRNNLVYFKAVLKYMDGTPAKYQQIENILQGFGEIIPNKQLTDKNGEAIFYYRHDALTISSSTESNNLEIKSVHSKDVSSSIVKLNLLSSPVILIHGYRESPVIFNNLKSFLSDKGIDAYILEYDSTLGVETAAKSLSSFIEKTKKDLFSKGIISNNFTLIAHSFGGLVSRYYSCSKENLLSENINKIVFLSVPHNGTDIALLAENFYKDQSIKDLSPGSKIFSEVFPAMINKGLNMNIQTANILGQYDEVVTPESASLSRWKIDTLLYEVGENARTFDNIINGSIIEAPNHNSVLNNQKIFERIFRMMTQNLSYPRKN